MKLIPDPASAKPDDYSVYVPGARWRPDLWDGEPIRGMGALHAARMEDRRRRRERLTAWRETWRQHGWCTVERHDGTTYRTPIADYSPRQVPLALLGALLLAPLARAGCRHGYRVDHFTAASWDFSPFYEGGGSWTDLQVPLLIVPLPFGRWLTLPRGLPEIVRDSS